MPISCYRYFMLDKGILVYGKGPNEISKGKIHGSVDIGLSVISTKLKRRRIDIDAEEFIYHLKAKTDETFNAWVQQLTAHRLYRQHVLTYGSNIGALFKAADGLRSIPRTPEILSRDGSLTRGLKGPNGSSRLTFWLQESLTSLEQFQRDAITIELNIAKLSRLLKQLESASVIHDNVSEVLSPNIKKDRRKFGLKKKKSASKGGSVDLTIQFSNKNIDSDNTSPLSTNSLSGVSIGPQHMSTIGASSLPVPITIPTPDSLSNTDAVSLSSEIQLRDDFVTVAKTVLNSLKSFSFGLSTERERLKNALDSENPPQVSQNIVNLKNGLNQAIQQNMELRNRLQKIQEAADVTELSILEHISEGTRPYKNSLSYSSSCVSATEFFDAEDLPNDKIKSDVVDFDGELEVQEEESEVRTRSESSSEAGSLSSGEGSISSESDIGQELMPSNNSLEIPGNQGLTGRRTMLPVPRPPTEGLSLWNLLSRNIGKDLSQISMPVALNEPLNVLQRLCEELEYSELLDKAAAIEDPYERMVEIAAFAVSAYASTYSRAGNKPLILYWVKRTSVLGRTKDFDF
ncbi:hypothetical protein WA026_018193 [Henosepilachna vigintioctopunctata]|uniref:Oxysterol-binding protein n=1 Tax=Henosepilachna vigintioctopunctata TaxID=420089 RepID=A0AAW1VDW6_9CUCU